MDSYAHAWNWLHVHGPPWPAVAVAISTHVHKNHGMCIRIVASHAHHQSARLPFQPNTARGTVVDGFCLPWSTVSLVFFRHSLEMEREITHCIQIEFWTIWMPMDVFFDQFCALRRNGVCKKDSEERGKDSHRA